MSLVVVQVRERDRADAEQLGDLFRGRDVHVGAVGGAQLHPAVDRKPLQGLADGLAAEPRCSASSDSTRCCPGLSEPLAIISASVS